MQQYYKKLFVILLLCGYYFFTPILLCAQNKQDSVFFLATKKGLLGKIGKSVSVNNSITSLPLEGAVKNAANFEPYLGKIIRHIYIQKIGFTKYGNDSLSTFKNFFNQLGDHLHVSTKENIIRNNLFFTEGEKVYPNLMADNEKFLHDLSFLQDAKIIIDEIESTQDSVDVEIILKDVFPIGGSVSEANPNKSIFELNNDNLFGTGNRIQINNLIDLKRNPTYGIGLSVLKRNVSGSFLDLSLGFDNQHPTFNSNQLQETNVYVKGNLPLVSPYHAITGGFELSKNKTINRYDNDSLYQLMLQYNYSNIDVWIGVNIGTKKYTKLKFDTRLKKIISLRLFNRDFITVPNIQATHYDSKYADIRGLLASYTIFKQDFYHTNFIYGFGRNEDVPEGFNFSLTSGWTNKNDFPRYYVGFDYQRNYFNKKNNYLNYNFKGGGYYNSDRIEDISLLTSIEIFTRLRKLGKSTWYSRHFISGSLTQQINTFLNEPIRLSSIYGLPLLRNPNTLSSGRVSLNIETVFYNTWKFLGFNFAPFNFFNFSYLKDVGKETITGDFYTSIGGGIRTRNENLVFGTMELKFAYLPRVVSTYNVWNISFNTDLQFRYITELIKKPDFIRIN